MATSKKFSELPAASSVGNGDLFAIAHEDALAETGYVSQKLTAAQAGQKVNGDTEYPTSLPSFPANGQNPFAALEKLNADIDSLYPVNTASGSIANFTTSLEMPLVALSSTIVAQQASGTPTPSSPLPITGWDSVKITRCGKNFLEPTLLASSTVNGITFTALSDGTIRANGTATANATLMINNITGHGNLLDNLLPLNNMACIGSGCPSVSGCRVAFARMDGSSFNDDLGSGVSFTVSNLTPSTNAYVRLQVDSGYTVNNVIFKPMIRLASVVDDTYEAYNAETKTIALGQTVYGGVIDAKNGKATITHARVDLGSLDWTYRSDTKLFLSDTITSAKAVNNSAVCDALCEIYAANSRDNIWNNQSIENSFAINNNSKVLIRDTRYTDATNFKTAMNGQMLVYELATPIEITGLTPANFTTFAGEQNIFSDCGDVSVSFKQGIQEYIDAKIAETQALIL